MNEDGSLRLGPGILLTCGLVVAFAFFNDVRWSTQGDFENQTRSYQRIQFKPGTFFSGPAIIHDRIVSDTGKVTYTQEEASYRRQQKQISVQAKSGRTLVFVIDSGRLVDASGGIWNRKYCGD